MNSARAQEQRITVQPRDGGKLLWQSWLVLAAVAPWCAIAALRHAVAAWSGATQAGLGISLGLAFLVWLTRAATPLAALMGGLITAVLWLAPLGSSGLSSWSEGGRPYHSALPPLLALFLLTFSATRFGRGKKQRLGVAEDKRGRNAAQVAANLGVAGLGAAVALIYPLPGALYAVAVVAALAEATADTLASEVGEVLGGPPLLLTTLRRVTPGTDGAISLAGTVAGMSGAVVLVLVAVSTLELSVYGAASAVVGSIGGLFADSLLGATAERRGWLNNDAVNFLSTLAASVIAIVVFVLPRIRA
jgi:uncharacterized protein (TIGR00297 family)